jgi:uncharacterized protein (DUF2062 family)
MFLRRNKLTVTSKIRDFFWPKSGWRRSYAYIFYRLARIAGTPYTLAAGFACGAAISFTPFIGLHFILGGILAWVIRANILSSAIGTAIGNPWTFPFIWVGIYEVGKFFDPFYKGMKDVEPVLFDILSEMMDAMLHFDFTIAADSGWPVFRTMLIGCVPAMIFVWLMFYFALSPFVRKYQHSRIQRRIASKRSGENSP